MTIPIIGAGWYVTRPVPDRISVEGLRIHAVVGVYPHEAGLRQLLIVDVHLATDLTAAGRADDLGQAIDYDRVAAIVRELVTGRHHKLIEAVAERIADALFAELAGRVAEVRVKVAKPRAVSDAASVSVEIVRTPPIQPPV